LRIVALLSHKGYQSKTLHAASTLPAVNRGALLRRSPQREKFAVLDRPQDDPAGRVAALVRGFLAKRSIDRSVGRDDDLSASGLSSLDMVNLMLAVEAEFDLKIPDRKMTPSNFRSIACITELVQDLK
jgi:acyl carrier protein